MDDAYLIPFHGTGQRMRLGALGVWNTIHPWLGGIGISSCIVTLFVAIYYNVIITWCIFYFVNSFRVSCRWSSDNWLWLSMTGFHTSFRFSTMTTSLINWMMSFNCSSNLIILLCDFSLHCRGRRVLVIFLPMSLWLSVLVLPRPLTFGIGKRWMHRAVLKVRRDSNGGS